VHTPTAEEDQLIEYKETASNGSQKRSLRLHETQGMTETALGVDAEDPSSALQLYLSMGYKTVKRYVAYRKPMDAEPPTIGEGP